MDAHPRESQADLVSLILQRYAEPAQPTGRLQAIGRWCKRHFYIGGRYGV